MPWPVGTTPCGLSAPGSSPAAARKSRRERSRPVPARRGRNPRMDWPGTPVCRRAPRFWIPAFAGMTAKGQPRRPFNLIGNNIETATRISPPAPSPVGGAFLRPVPRVGDAASRRDNPLWLSAPYPHSAVIPAKAGIQGLAYDRPRRDNPSALPGSIAHLPAFAPVGPSRGCARIRREREEASMDFGKRMMTKAWVRAFFAPRRSRVVNSGEEEGLRNPGVVVRRGAARELWGGAGEGAPLRVSGVTRALRPRHNENDPVFDKIRQIHGLIPQIRAFFRQIQDPSEREKNIKSLKINRLCEKEAPGGGISRGRGVCAHPPALAPLGPAAIPQGAFGNAPPRQPNGQSPGCRPMPSKRAVREPPLRTMKPRMD